MKVILAVINRTSYPEIYIYIFIDCKVTYKI